jgi:nitronate monooxygenase
MMTIKPSFAERFDLAGPLMVAPMGGGPTTPELVAAVSNAGAMGSVNRIVAIISSNRYLS